MRIPHFWRRQGATAGGGRPVGNRAWRDSGVADEVEAYLTGRIVDHLSVRHTSVPAWAVLNRLAHADRDELEVLVAGEGGGHGAFSVISEPPWASSERCIAANLLARAPTPEELVRIQRTTLIPVELRLIERSKVGRITAEQVLEAGAEAVGTFRSDR